MATAVQAFVTAIVRYVPHAAVAALALAIAAHLVHLEGIAEFLGDAAFFLLVLAVITAREARVKDAR